MKLALPALLILLTACPVAPVHTDAGSTDAGDSGVFDPGAGDGGCWSQPEQIRGAELAGGGVFAIDGLENVVALWTQGAQGRQHLFANRHSPDGGWGVPEPLPVDAGYLSASLAVNSSGLAAAVWLEGEFGTLNGSALKLARYLPDAGWQPPELVSAASPTHKQAAQVAMDDRGSITVAWLEPLAVNGGTALWVRRFDAVSSAWAAPLHFASPPFQSEASQPALAMNGSGQVVIGYLFGVNDLQVRAAASLADGGWSDDVVGGGRYIASGVSAAISSGGEAVVAWAQGLNSNGDWRVTAVSRQGEQWSAPATLDSAGPGIRWGASVAIDGAGRALVAWTQGSPVGSGTDPHVAYLDDAAWGPPLALPHEEGKTAFGMAAATNTHGLGVLAWQTDLEIWAVKLHAPFTLSPPTLISSGYPDFAHGLGVAVSPAGTRWLLLAGRGSDPSGILVSHCP